MMAADTSQQAITAGNHSIITAATYLHSNIMIA